MTTSCCATSFRRPKIFQTQQPNSHNWYDNNDNYENCTNVFEIFELGDGSELTKDDKREAQQMLLEKYYENTDHNNGQSSSKYYENTDHNNGQSSSKIVAGIVSNLAEIRKRMSEDNFLEHTEENQRFLEEVRLGCELLKIKFEKILGLLKNRSKWFPKPLPRTLKALIRELGNNGGLSLSRPTQEWLKSNCGLNIECITRLQVEIFQSDMQKKTGTPPEIKYLSLITPPPAPPIHQTRAKHNVCRTHKEHQHTIQNSTVRIHRQKSPTISKKIFKATITRIEDDEIKRNLIEYDGSERITNQIDCHTAKYDDEEKYNQENDIESRRTEVWLPSNHQENRQQVIAADLATLLIEIKTNPYCEIKRQQFVTWPAQHHELSEILSFTFDSSLSIQQIHYTHELLEKLVKVIETHMEHRLKWIQNEIRQLLEEICGTITILVHNTRNTHKQHIDENNTVIQLRNTTHRLLDSLAI